MAQPFTTSYLNLVNVTGLGVKTAVINQMINLTLVHRDVCLDQLKSGVKFDTWNLLSSAIIYSSTLILDDIIRKAEDNISTSNRFTSQLCLGSWGSSRKQHRFQSCPNSWSRTRIPVAVLHLPSLNNHLGDNQGLTYIRGLCKLYSCNSCTFCGFGLP